jgi:two-component system, cell cycle response regulator CtrA
MPSTDLEILMSTVAVAGEASTAVGSSSRPNSPSTIRSGDLVVDLNNRVVSVDDKRVHLTGKEYGILELLSLHKGTTITKEMFLNHLYHGVHEPELKIIDVFVSKLRKKLAQATGGNHYIATIWGRGYVLRDPTPPPAGTLVVGADDRDAHNDEAGSRAA